MKDGYIRICTPCIKTMPGAVNNNVQQIIDKTKECYQNGAKVIAYPSLSVCGVTALDLLYQTSLLESSLEGLKKIADSCLGKECLVVISLPYKYQGKVYNALCVIDGSKNINMTFKSVLLPSETRYFNYEYDTQENISFDGYNINIYNDLVYKVNDLVIGFAFFDEVISPLNKLNRLYELGANACVVISGNSEIVNRSKNYQKILEAESLKYNMAVVYTTSGLGESTQDNVYSGYSLIIECGKTLSENLPFEFKDNYCDIDCEAINSLRIKNSLIYQKKTKYINLKEVKWEKENYLNILRKFSRFPFVPEEEDKKWERALEVLTIQAHGLKKRIEHVRPKSLVVGLSGGLDSCLALLVMVRAVDLLNIDRKSIIAVSMPCFGTTRRTKSNASELALALGVRFKEIDIKEATTVHLKDIGHDIDNHNVTYENAQARERTQILMDIANMENGLVIGTGDLSELALGWATYNGDHMSMYGVNGNIPKTLVRHLVQYEAKIAKSKNLHDVLIDIYNTPVSPELLPPKDGEISQVTEDIVGPYELHDFFLYYYMKYGFRPSKIYRIALETFEGIYTKDIIKKWLLNFYNRFFTQQFKRSCLPDGPKVGSIGVSPRGDLAMSSDSIREDYIKEIENIK